MRVLVSGGAGYIGSFAVRGLLARGHEVLVLDNLSTGRREAVPGQRVEVVDVRDEPAVTRVVAGFEPDAVIHFAALKSPQESVARPGLYLDVNVTGTANLLDAATRHGARHFVLSSSCAVYGTPQVCPVDERAPARPVSPYGESKLISERLVERCARARGVRYANLRYFNAAGAALDGSLGEHLPPVARQVVPLAVRAALGLEPCLNVFGDDYPTRDGTALRDYVHVEDLARGHVDVLDALSAEDVSGTYNLGQGVPTSVREVVRALGRAAGCEVPVRVGPRREGDPSVSWADSGLAGRVFDWVPRHGLDDIVGSAWRWHHDHPETLGRPACT